MNEWGLIGGTVALVVVLMLLAEGDAQAEDALLPDGYDDRDGDSDEMPPHDDPAPMPAPYPDAGSFAPLWMLPGISQAGRPKTGGKFGVRRPLTGGQPTHHHSGVDLGAPRGTAIVAPEDGTVVRHQGWAGKGAKAMLVQLFSGPVLVLGGVDGPSRWPVGKAFKRGDTIARVGKYDGTAPGRGEMLHLEMWQVGVTSRPSRPWKWKQAPPPKLVDVTPYVERMV